MSAGFDAYRKPWPSSGYTFTGDSRPFARRPLRWPPFEAGVCHAYRGKSNLATTTSNMNAFLRHNVQRGSFHYVLFFLVRELFDANENTQYRI